MDKNPTILKKQPIQNMQQITIFNFELDRT